MVSYLLLVFCCFVVLPIVLTRGPLALTGGDGAISRLAEWAVGQDERRGVSVDDWVVLYRLSTRRLEVLGAQLERLRRLIATDEAMSATRQLANRIAYEQVLHELRVRPELDPAYGDLEIATLRPALRADGPLRTVSGRPDIEVLDFGWRPARH